MRLIGLLFAALVTLVPAAHAQDRYVFDPGHTQIGFTIDRFGFNNVIGRFDQVTGSVILDSANPENSSVTAEVQMSNLNAGDPTRDEHLEGERWLNIAAHPTMSFRSTSVTRTGENTALVAGELTLNGQTHPLTLAVTLNKIGPAPNNQRQAAGFTAAGRLARADWGIAIAPNLIGADVEFTIEALGYLEAAQQ